MKLTARQSLIDYVGDHADTISAVGDDRDLWEDIEHVIKCSTIMITHREREQWRRYLDRIQPVRWPQQSPPPKGWNTEAAAARFLKEVRAAITKSWRGRYGEPRPESTRTPNH